MMLRLWSFFFNDPAPTEIYTLSLHDALPISRGHAARPAGGELRVRVPVPRRLDGIGGRRALQARRGLLHPGTAADRKSTRLNSSHTVISYAVFCLKKKKQNLHIEENLTGHS